jgi:hypothetical protein
MLLRKTLPLFLFIVAVCAIQWTARPPSEDEGLKPSGARGHSLFAVRDSISAVAMAAPPFASGQLYLIASDFTFVDRESVILVPTNPAVLEEIEGPVISSVSIPSDPKRKVLSLMFNATFTWEQILSAAPVHFDGRYQVNLMSPQLPPPGEFKWGGFGLGRHIEMVQSDNEVIRTVGFTREAAFEENALGALICFNENFPDLTLEEAVEIARRVLRSDMTIEIRPLVTLSSVSFFQVGRFRGLTVWGG